DSIALVLAHVDNCIQYGEDLEPKEPRLDEFEDLDEAGDGSGDNTLDWMIGST
ncbi:unnamed protein product, partial [Heterosigma akashiwo]